MEPVQTFVVQPKLPQALSRLKDLAYNLRWSWNHETIELFRRLDPDLWETTQHNPYLMLGTIDQARLVEASEDEGYISQFIRVVQDLDAYMKTKSTWFTRNFKGSGTPLIAYFSAEFGITECLSIFAGGLGILAGDHLKSASDLGLPLVGVGLLYQQGYFTQYLNDIGWQQEAYEDNDFNNLPITPVKDTQGEFLKIRVPHPGREVVVQIWKAQIGRVPLYLLDTNIPDNSDEDKDITDQLYGGTNEMRIRQEMVLGIGGYRALKALGYVPTVYHLNEGHSAFLTIERTRRYMEEKNHSFKAAIEASRAGVIFTTHTPVPAGHDVFSPELVNQYLGNYINSLGISIDEFMALGRKHPENPQAPFVMTILGLKMASYSNGVAKLHGKVSREMWKDLYPGVPVDEIPITHNTNGTHFQSWLSKEMKDIYDRYLGYGWREELADQDTWDRSVRISSEELWRTHQHRRDRLVDFCRNRLRAQLKSRGASKAAIQAADEALDPNILTIGFARRFATYKRATLILKDLDRLDKILNHPEHPVQIIFAGKAHPRDDPGKDIIRQIVSTASQERFRNRIVFLENYDMSVARYLVQGSDIWLNTPRRPREASGTSGMKATANGLLNLSILDGWWDEGYAPEYGWAIGRRETYQDPEYQDQLEAEILYGLLENEIVPMFYNRKSGRLPREWINRMKLSIKNLCRYFNTHRMVSEYAERFYFPVSEHFQQFTADGMQKAVELADWKDRVRNAWGQIRIIKIIAPKLEDLKVGDVFEVSVQVEIGELKPEDLCVELLIGPVNPTFELTHPDIVPLELSGRGDKGTYMFKAKSVTCKFSGLQGFTARVLPNHPDLVTRFLPGMITWA